MTIRSRLSDTEPMRRPAAAKKLVPDAQHTAVPSAQNSPVWLTRAR